MVGGTVRLMLEVVMTLGDGGVNDSGNVNWQGCSAATATGCDCFFKFSRLLNLKSNIKNHPAKYEGKKDNT